MARDHRRRGFSLLELLVTLAILGVLLGLLLPAVQKARAASARAACQHNLRQIGLALHLHHDARGHLPPGVSVRADRSGFQFLSWGARLTPYLEQGVLWRQIEEAFATDPRPNEFHGYWMHARCLGTPMRIFGCPSDSRVPGPALIGIYLASFSSYLGVEGTDQTARDGVLYLDSATRLTDVTDGTAHTLLVGERPPSADLSFGWWYRGWGQERDGSAEMVLGARERNATGSRYRCPPGPYRFVPGQFHNQCDMFHFWSPHPGGANFLFVDGSVRLLDYSADPILPALATRGSGEVVQQP